MRVVEYNTMLFNIYTAKRKQIGANHITHVGVGAAQADHGYTLEFERILELTIYCRRKTD